MTEDLDISFHFPNSGGGLIDLAPLYKWLAERGHNLTADDHVLIEGIPVQFLPPPTKLVEEALSSAIDEKYADVGTRVFQYEYLLAIAAETGRSKDKLRIALALESRAPDESRLKDILQRHNLLDKWSGMTS